MLSGFRALPFRGHLLGAVVRLSIGEECPDAGTAFVGRTAAFLRREGERLIRNGRFSLSGGRHADGGILYRCSVMDAVVGTAERRRFVLLAFVFVWLCFSSRESEG